MLSTPADLKDFALGFSLTEGIVARRSDVFDIEIEEAPEGNHATSGNRRQRFRSAKRTSSQPRRSHRLRLVRRGELDTGHAQAAACGRQRELPACRVVRRDAPFTPLNKCCNRQQVQSMRQVILQPTAISAMYAKTLAAINALDKTLGALAVVDANPDGALLITSRASFRDGTKIRFHGLRHPRRSLGTDGRCRASGRQAQSDAGRFPAWIQLRHLYS